MVRLCTHLEIYDLDSTGMRDDGDLRGVFEREIEGEAGWKITRQVVPGYSDVV